jgi:hypothetical protein
MYTAYTKHRIHTTLIYVVHRYLFLSVVSASNSALYGKLTFTLLKHSSNEFHCGLTYFSSQSRYESQIRGHVCSRNYMYSRGQKKLTLPFPLHRTKGHETKMKQKRNNKTEAQNETEIVKDETESSVHCV